MRIGSCICCLLVVLLSIAPAARGQICDPAPTQPLNFSSKSPPPIEWKLLSSDGEEIESVTEYQRVLARGPLFSDGGGRTFCAILTSFGDPSVTADFEAEPRKIIELSYVPLSGGISNCQNVTPLFSVDVFISPLSVGEYEFRYTVPDEPSRVVSLPFDVVPVPSDAPPLTSGRVTFDPVGQEASDILPTAGGANFTWSRFPLASLDDQIRLVTQGAGNQVVVPTSENVNLLSSPQVDANEFVVWAAVDENDPETAEDNDFDIFVALGDVSINVSDSEVDDEEVREDLLPRISGSRVVWQGRKPPDPPPVGFDARLDPTLEIYYAELSDFASGSVTVRRITENALVDRDPRISGSWVVWEGIDDHDTEEDEDDEFDIFWVDLDATPCDSEPCPRNPIEDPDDPEHALNDLGPWVSGSRVVWQRAMPDDEGEEIHFEIFYADLPDLAAPAAAQRLTHNDYTDQNAYIAGPHVVFASLVPDLDVPACLGPFLTDFEVFYANLDLDDGAGTPLLWRVTQNDADDVNPRVRGPAPQVDERVAIFWEVFVFDRVDLLTLDAQALSISSPPPPGIRLSIDSVDQFSGFDISESLVVWTEVVNDEPPEGDEESDPAENSEIFSAPLVEVPEPGPIARMLAALGSMALFAAIRRRALSR